MLVAAHALTAAALASARDDFVIALPPLRAARLRLQAPRLRIAVCPQAALASCLLRAFVPQFIGAQALTLRADHSKILWAH